MLCRQGCMEYTLSMLDQLNEMNIRGAIASDSPHDFPSSFLRLKTYTTSISFAFNTFIHLPSVIRRLTKEIRRFDPDIVWFPGFCPWHPLLMKRLKKTGIPMLYTVHDAIQHPGEGNCLLQRLRIMAMKRADQLMFLTEYVQNRLNVTTDSFVIPHPVLSLPGLKKYKRELSKPVQVLFIGRALRYKGCDLLLEAVRSIPHIELTIAGRGAGHFMDKQINVIDKWLSESEMVQLINDSHILALPYREASQSGIITIGIAASIPMLISRVGGLSEQLNEAEACWVDPTVESIKEGLERLTTEVPFYDSVQSSILQKDVNPQIQEAFISVISSISKQ